MKIALIQQKAGAVKQANLEKGLAATERAANEGAQLIVFAELAFEPFYPQYPAGLYEAEMQIAAFQNGYFTALCNRVGKEDHLHFSGGSFVCGPNGKVLAQAGSSTEEILYCEINLEEVKSSHARRLFFPDRRPELYKDMI